MNIPKIGEGDMDGVEFTLSGENYWRYMNTHPDEVYTVEGFDNSRAEPQYILSGRMGGNTWYSDELLLQPAPQDRFEVIKNMTPRRNGQELAADDFEPVRRRCPLCGAGPGMALRKA